MLILKAVTSGVAASVHQIAREAALVAAVTGCAIEIDFNGTPLLVPPDMPADEAAAYWWERHHRKAAPVVAHTHRPQHGRARTAIADAESVCRTRVPHAMRETLVATIQGACDAAATEMCPTCGPGRPRS